MDVGMKPSISRAALADLRALAAAEPDREICGLLLGELASIGEIRPCANVSEAPETSFEIDPVALIAAHREARQGGAMPIGCYHSHPNGVAEPSSRDAASADASMPLWLIIAGDEVRAWIWGDSGFAEVELMPE